MAADGLRVRLMRAISPRILLMDARRVYVRPMVAAYIPVGPYPVVSLPPSFLHPSQCLGPILMRPGMERTNTKKYGRWYTRKGSSTRTIHKPSLDETRKRSRRLER